MKTLATLASSVKASRPVPGSRVGGFAKQRGFKPVGWIRPVGLRARDAGTGKIRRLEQMRTALANG